MQKTCPLYDEQLKQQISLACTVRIRCGLVDPDAAEECVFKTLPKQTYYSDLDFMLHDPHTPQTSYATLEPGRMRADGALRILPEPAFGGIVPEGFVSDALSDLNGAFAADSVPSFVCSFSKLHSIPGLSFLFDTVCSDYPAEIEVKAFRGADCIFSKSYAPDNAVYTTNDGIDRFDSLSLRFPRMTKPRRRLRIARLTFGFGLTFDSREVIKASQKTEIDPISRRLSHSSFDFTVINVNTLTGYGAQCLYNPDNARGVFRYLGRQNPVTLEYGQQLSDGSTFWIPGGRYELTGQPDTDGLTARFTAQDALSGLSGTFSRGAAAPGGQSLYTLAQLVLRDSGLRLTPDGKEPWELWQGLKNIRCSAPLPVKKHKELLQLIAHAACCVLYTDRRGYIRIEPAPQDEPVLTLGADEMLEYPRVREIPTLRAVHCPVYSYVPDETASQLHKETYHVNGTLQLHLSYPLCTNAQITADGAAIRQAELYAAAADITLEGFGDAAVTVTGQKLNISTHDVCCAAEFPDETSCDEQLDNPLITSSADAARVADWVKNWLCLRSTYEFPYRGRPELDVQDTIRVESPFSAQPVPARILKTELSFDGGLHGSITAKNLTASEHHGTRKGAFHV